MIVFRTACIRNLIADHYAPSLHVRIAEEAETSDRVVTVQKARHFY
jgi:hypothetical protein